MERELIECEIVRELEDFKSNIKITIMQGLPKKDKMDLVIPKISRTRNVFNTTCGYGKMHSKI